METAGHFPRRTVHDGVVVDGTRYLALELQKYRML